MPVTDATVGESHKAAKPVVIACTSTLTGGANRRAPCSGAAWVSETL